MNIIDKKRKDGFSLHVSCLVYDINFDVIPFYDLCFLTINQKPYR